MKHDFIIKNGFCQLFNHRHVAAEELIADIMQFHFAPLRTVLRFSGFFILAERTGK
jgi:hypothetical protein